MSFKRLLEPLKIKRVTFRNRMVKPPQRMAYANKDGSMSQRALDFYESIARGGVGALIVEHAYVDFPLGVRGIQFSAADDKAIPSLARLAGVIHKHGCPAIQQISHVGPQYDSAASGLPALAPSLLGEDYMKKNLGRIYNLKSLTITEIEDIVRKFCLAAERVQKAGYDGLEIHAGHNYLLSCFLSRVWNKRDDEYGGQTVDSRARFAVQVLRAVRERVGPDFLVGIRMNGGEYGAADGTTSRESRQIAKILESGGADYIHVLIDTYGCYKDPPRFIISGESDSFNVRLDENDRKTISTGLTVRLTAMIKQEVKVPVIAAGKMDPVLGESALQNGQADLIAIGRRLFADPELPNKVMAGKLEDIRPCINCGTCFECNSLGRAVKCSVNPTLGHESESDIKPAEKPKKVVVVGGGPAGMEVSRLAALRGHEVTLYEKEKGLGGLLPLAALIKGLEYENVTLLNCYLRTQINKLGLQINTGEKFSPENIGEIKPDVLILATGGLSDSPDIPGIEKSIVLTSDDLRRRVKFFLRLLGPRVMGRLTKFWLPIGKNVVIIGGLIHGCETAEFLVKRGRKVTIVEKGELMGLGIPEFPNRKLVLEWLTKKGVDAFTGVDYKEITDRGLVITTGDGKEKTLEADTIILALPPRADTKILETFKGKVPEVYLIGDARQSNLIAEALADGFQIGRTI